MAELNEILNIILAKQALHDRLFLSMIRADLKSQPDPVAAAELFAALFKEGITKAIGENPDDLAYLRLMDAADTFFDQLILFLRSEA